MKTRTNHEEAGKELSKMPRFLSEDEETTWWASAEGRQFFKQHPVAGSSRQRKGSPLVNKLGRASSVQRETRRQ